MPDKQEHNQEQESFLLRSESQNDEIRLAKLLSSPESYDTGGTVELGSVVIVTDGINTGKRYLFKIVSSSEANRRAGLIAYESFLGQALMGHKKGDVVMAQSPSGVLVYEINAVIDSYTFDRLINYDLKKRRTQVEITPDLGQLTGGVLSLDIRINEEPLTARHLANIISAITELHTKSWLIQHGRYDDCLIYAKTRDSRFEDEANLTIARLKYNSPAEIRFNFDLSPKSLIEAITTAINSIRSAPHQSKAQELDNRAKELEIKAKEREHQEKQLELDKKRIEYALEIASKMVETLRPGVSAEMKAALMEALLPNLLQLGDFTELELVLPASSIAVMIDSRTVERNAP